MPYCVLILTGLGHPAIFEGSAQPGVAGQAVREVFTTFGAVPVSGKVKQIHKIVIITAYVTYTYST
jgi:hypothetical protein